MGVIRVMFSLISFLAARKQILQSWTLQQTFCALDDSTDMMVCFIKVIIVNTKKPGEKLRSSKDKSLKPFTFRLQMLPRTRLNRFIQVSNLHWSVLPPPAPTKPSRDSLAHGLTGEGRTTQGGAPGSISANPATGNWAGLKLFLLRWFFRQDCWQLSWGSNGCKLFSGAHQRKVRKNNISKLVQSTMPLSLSTPSMGKGTQSG